MAHAVTGRRRVDVHLAERYRWPLAQVEALPLWVRDWLALHGGGNSVTVPTPPAPVERKVKAATAAAGGSAAAVSAIVLALLTYLWPNMNAGYKFEIAALAPGALAAAGAFAAGYRARHTPRPPAALPSYPPGTPPAT